MPHPSRLPQANTSLYYQQHHTTHSNNTFIKNTTKQEYKRKALKHYNITTIQHIQNRITTNHHRNILKHILYGQKHMKRH